MIESPNNLPRRTVLGAGLAVSAWSFFPASKARAEPSVDVTGDFAAMRAQWRSLHVAGDYDPTDETIAAVLVTITKNAQSAWTSMRTAPDRTFLWEDAQLEIDISFAISRSFSRLYQMALGWATTGSEVAGDASLLAALIDGLDWMVEHYYREDGEVIGNWFEWQIAGPQSFNNAAVIVYDELTPEQVAAYTRSVAHYTPEPLGTAANLALTANVVVGRGVLAEDPDAIQLGVSAVDPVFEYVTHGDGFYRDGSFIQHDYYPYISSYGISIMDALIPMITMVAGTDWEIAAPVVYDWLENACEPLLWRGALMDMVSGRTIARWNEHEHYHGRYLLSVALGLTPGVPPDRLARFQSVLKEWLLDDSYLDPTPTSTIPALLRATELKEDEAVERRGPLELSKVFHNQDRIVHRREDWALGISMRSSRIANFESINDENLRGWLTADGATYLYIGDASQFMDGFWATVDPARMPGTTVDVRERQPREGAGTRSSETWAGGAALGERLVAGGMILQGAGSSLSARKSWMCFDNEIVALGSGVTATDGRSVETIIENRRLSPGIHQKLIIDGAEQVAEPGTSAEVRRADWMHLEGTGGYVFPKPAEVRLKRDSRTGRWSDITQHPNWALTDPITHDYLTAWVDHGIDPADQGYAYILLPGASVAQTSGYSARPEVSIIANTAAVQAVHHRRAGIIAANFWEPGRASLVRTNGALSIILRRTATRIELAAADPTHLGTSSVIKIGVRVKAVESVDPGMRVLDLDPLTVEVDPAGLFGASLRLAAAV